MKSLTAKKYPINQVKLPRELTEAFPGLRTVSDATDAVQVTVSDEDREATTRRRAQRKPIKCIFAAACQRQLNVDGALISLSRSYLIRGTHAVRYVTPESVTREIVGFDRGGVWRFALGSYELRPVSPAARYGHPVRPRIPGKTDGSRPRKSRVIHYTQGIRSLGNG